LPRARRSIYHADEGAVGNCSYEVGFRVETGSVEVGGVILDNQGDELAR
jgi:hypothetical protein